MNNDDAQKRERERERERERYPFYKLVRWLKMTKVSPIDLGGLTYQNLKRLGSLTTYLNWH